MAETCGALTDVSMIIGLKYERISAEDEQTKERAYSLVREIADKFGEVCREVFRK